MNQYLPAIAALFGGFAIGLFHFASLRYCVDAFAAGRVARAISLQMLRFAVTAGAFIGLAMLGALPLLAAALGLLGARAALLRRARSAS